MARCVDCFQEVGWCICGDQMDLLNITLDALFEAQEKLAKLEAEHETLREAARDLLYSSVFHPDGTPITYTLRLTDARKP